MHAHHFGPHPGHVGGMATVLALLAELQIGADSVTVHPTWIPKDRRRTIRLTLAALGAVQRLGPGDVVHVHLATRGSLIREGAILLDASRRGLPTVASLHGADFAEFAGRNPEFVRRVLRHARVVTALSEDAEAAARALAPDSVTRLIPNPIPIQEGTHPASKTDRIVLFAGEIGTRKGVDVLESAWSLVHRRIPSARCLVVGPYGDLTPRPREGLTILPARSPAAIGQLLQEARVAVLPSRAEGMPMFLLEAMAAARPFVATPVGANARLAERGGILVPVGNHDGLADALVRVLEDPGLAERLGNSGQSFCRSTRSPAVVAAAYDEAYREAAARARGRSERRSRSFRAEPRQDTSVDRNGGARDEAREPAVDKEGHERGDVPGRADPAQRSSGDEV